ncbi:MAG: HD domain-containing phosphohydrolase [Eubacterium sp.]|nr:HD domain-containing phosphohydrolase [Eubacterium sp.]
MCRRGFAILLIALFVLAPIGVAAGTRSVTTISLAATSQEDKKSDLLDRLDKVAYFLYDNTNGLPTSEANTIAQTKDGFIWIGSYSGLISYDGTTFHRFDAESGVASVVCLFVDSRDRLWIGTNDSGLALYDKGEFIFFNQNEGLKSSSIRAITEDKNGDILIATTQGMAYVSDDLQLHVVDDPQINNEYIKQIKSDGFGSVYGVTMTGGIFKFEDKHVTSFISQKNSSVDAVNCICPDLKNENYVYIGTDHDYIWYGDISNGFSDAKKYRSGECKSINNIQTIANRIWVCAENGLGWLDGQKVFRQLKNTPLTSSIDDVMIDHEGNYWAVSSRQGVMKAVSDQFTDITKMAGLGALVVNSTCFYEDLIYIGADSGLYAVDLDYREKKDSLMRSLEGVRVRCLMKDDKENLWISTFDGKMGLLCRDKNGTVTTFTEKEGLSSNWIRSTYLLSDGTVAVAASGGVSLIRDGKIIRTYGAEDGINNSEILTICEGPDEKLYFGSDGDGIYVVDHYQDANASVSRIGLSDGLPSEVVLRIRYDETRKVYWVITSNALAVLKEGKAEKIHKFPYSNNFDIQYDNKGNIWVLSSNGLYEVNASQLYDNQEIDCQHYDATSGLNCVPTANSWSALMEDGTLYIAGSTGVSSVNINNIEDEAQDVRLTVPLVVVDDEEIHLSAGQPVTIPDTASRLVIHGYAVSFSLKNPKITYKLGGFDTTEAVTTKADLSPITYTNLAGGTYLFKMNVVNTVTGVVENSYQLTIEKELKFSENPWFILVETIAAIVVIVGIVGMIAFRRLRREKRKTKETQEFVDQTISAFAKLIDAKDKYTQGHSRRVAAYTEKLAIKLGYKEDDVRKYKNIALLHDIGKVAIPDSILNKPQGLTDEEYEIMKSHAERGREILEEIKIDPDLALGAGFHHERFDGRGYPEGRHSDNIPPVAQLIAIADTFDAMYSTRPYRKQLPLSVVLDELRSIAGTQLNETYVKAFLELAEAGELVDLAEAKRREEAQEQVPEQPPTEE